MIPALEEFPSLPVDDSHEDPDVIPDTADEYSFQDETEDIASTSYDNSAIADDFNYSNRAVVYQDVLDQPSYVQYCYQHFLYPDLNPSSLSSVSAPAPKLDKKMMPCFQYAKQNCPKKADECQYSHDRAVIKAYLDAQHAKVTGSKETFMPKLFMIRLRKLSRPLKSLLVSVPPKFIPTTSHWFRLSSHHFVHFQHSCHFFPQFP